MNILLELLYVACLCLNRADIIRVYDGKSAADPAIRVLCNEGSEIEILSSGPDLFIEFVANSDWPGQGFKAKYQFQPSEDNSIESHPYHRLRTFSAPTEVEPSVSETRSSCDIVISSDTNKNGTLTSPSYPTSYPPKTTCRYEFQGRGKERVQIVFQEFNLYQAVATIREMEKIDSFCGSALPKPVMSNGPRIKLEFVSLVSPRFSRGFRATYAFTESKYISNSEFESASASVEHG
ncbi:unnamed protein product [Phaedon cochleariae]|uniref:CUB domain-containing protein n=1 Tax=Phaedon cochleariae TaxID=80249 RepID=A0A9N9SHC6_PHACE|nr:unnamed protein product [Phaedon cochleariae]